MFIFNECAFVFGAGDGTQGLVHARWVLPLSQLFTGGFREDALPLSHTLVPQVS